MRNPNEVVSAEYAPPERLDYVPQAPPPAGGFVALRPGLRWLRMPLPMALDHINLWLVEEAGGWVLIDTGMGTDATRALWERQAPELLAGMPLRRIVLTHFHPDHAGLAGWLQARHGVPVWMSRATQAVLDDWVNEDPGAAAAISRGYFGSHGVEDEAELELMSGSGARRRYRVDPLPEVERFLADGDRLEWSGRTWRIHATDGHATGHLCLESPADGPPPATGLLIAGDQVLPTISPNVSLYARPLDPDPLGSYLESLTRLAALGDPLVLPSHGLPFHGLRTRIGALERHHAAQLEKLLAACGEGARSAHELLSVMYRRALGPFDKTLGIGETVAHLEYLATRGRLERRVDAHARVTFRATAHGQHAKGHDG